MRALVLTMSRFNIGGNFGMDFLNGKLFYKMFTCPLNGVLPTIPIDTTVTGETAETGKWKYDASDKQYHFNLKVNF